MQGVVTQIEEKQATVILTNGIILRDIPINMPDDPDTLQTQKRDTYNHRLVSITQSGETAVLTKCSFSNKTTGEWTIVDNKLGSKLVSPRVQVYEEVIPGAPLNHIALADIDLSKIPSSDIRYTVSDSAGTITNIVLSDVTGDSWLYGMGHGEKKFVPPSDGLKNVPWNNLTKEAQQNHVDDGSSTHPSTVDNVSWNELTKDAQDEYRKNHPSSYKYYVVLNHWDTTEKKKIEASYKVLDLPSGLSGGPIAVPKGYSTDESIVNTSLDIKSSSSSTRSTARLSTALPASARRTATMRLPISSAFTTRKTVNSSLRSRVRNRTTRNSHCTRTIRPRTAAKSVSSPSRTSKSLRLLPLRREPYFVYPGGLWYTD